MDPACSGLIAAMDLAGSTIVMDNGYECRIAKIGETLQAAVYCDPKERWYIRAVDLAVLRGQGPEAVAAKKKLNGLVGNFVGMWNPSDTRNSAAGAALLKSYRAAVGDETAPMSARRVPV